MLFRIINIKVRSEFNLFNEILIKILQISGILLFLWKIKIIKLSLLPI